MADLVFIDASVGSVCESLVKQTLASGFKISQVLEQGVTICVCSRVQPTSASLAKASRRTKKMMAGNPEQVCAATVSCFLIPCHFTFF